MLGNMKNLEENINTGSIAGMGAVTLPTATQTGSGDVPANSGDAEEEYEKKKKKKKMKKLQNFESFISEIKHEILVTEAFSRMPKDTIENELYAASQALTTYYDWLKAGNDSGKGESIDHVISLLKKCKSNIKRFNKPEEVKGTVYESYDYDEIDNMSEAKDPKVLEIKHIKFDIELCKKSKSASLRSQFNDIIRSGQGALKTLDESLVTEKFKFSKKEVEAAANLIASAISQADMVKAKVHDLEYVKGKGAGFEISIDGEKYDGGSYTVKDNGDVVNAAIGNKHPNAVYNTIGNKDIADVFINMEKYESLVSEAKFKIGDRVSVLGRSSKKPFDSGEVTGIQRDGTILINGLETISHEVAIDAELVVKESVVNEAKFVKEFNKEVLDAKTKEEVTKLYPNAKFYVGKSDHFFGDLEDNLFFKAYYTKAQKEFKIKSVYSEKGSNYVHLYNESIVNEAATKSAGLVQFAADEKAEGKNAEIHLATFDGSGMEAQSTNKTWDDGVPVTKNFTRGGYKRVSPKGEVYIIESDLWWYFTYKAVWYAVKRKDYGTPPFEY